MSFCFSNHCSFLECVAIRAPATHSASHPLTGPRQRSAILPVLRHPLQEDPSMAPWPVTASCSPSTWRRERLTESMWNLPAKSSLSHSWCTRIYVSAVCLTVRGRHLYMHDKAWSSCMDLPRKWRPLPTIAKLYTREGWACACERVDWGLDYSLVVCILDSSYMCTMNH